MRTTNLTDVLATAGLRQRLYAEPTIVEEFCGSQGTFCLSDADCCPSLRCDIYDTNACYCYVC